jgi:hypothetical protein
LAGNFWSGKPAARKKNILSKLASHTSPQNPATIITIIITITLITK